MLVALGIAWAIVVGFFGKTENLYNRHLNACTEGETARNMILSVVSLYFCHSDTTQLLFFEDCTTRHMVLVRHSLYLEWLPVTQRQTSECYSFNMLKLVSNPY